MNTQLVESLVQAIRALLAEERALFDAKLYGEISYASNLELAHRSKHSRIQSDKEGQSRLRTIGWLE